jgi:dihydroorotase
MNLGMALEDVVATSTATPAKAIGRSGELGTSRIGVAGDAAVFALEAGRFSYDDTDGNRIEGARRWAPRVTVRSGRMWWRSHA